MTDYGAHLLPQHQKLLEKSGISVEVAAQRGYRSVETKAELDRKGFSVAQRNVPALLIPIYNTAKEFETYQLRPDEPRVGPNGKAIKYETARGTRIILDVPQSIQSQLSDPSVPLWITEGSRKADAAVTKGLCCISLTGVWGWRGSNTDGGTTALADWENVALNGRQVYLAFDSDALTKAEVHSALIRFQPFLERRGATVSIVYLPPNEDGTKVGLDDYLADGHSADDLLALATPELRPLQHDRDAEKEAAEAYALARPLLESPHLWELIKRAFRWGGFAGDLVPALLIYIALTSRLLARPLNLALVAASAAGKNYSIDTSLGLFPESAYFLVKAGSERALIYADEDFQHRFVIMQEADSLPMEDGSAASAVRALADDNCMSYHVVERDSETGRFGVREIEKPGPTGLITTTTRPLGPQLATRMLNVTISDTPEQTRDVLRVQAANANGASPAPLDTEPFAALQTWLALAGDREVVIPFAPRLGEVVPIDLVRMRRDFVKLLAVIQANAILFQQQRARDEHGRIIATEADYEVARELLGEVFTAAATGGVTKTVRETVEAVAQLTGTEGRSVTVAELAKHLGLHPSTTWRRAANAMGGGFLVNQETRRRQPALLVLGQELPGEKAALPPFEDLPPNHLLETDAIVQSAGEIRIGAEASEPIANGIADGLQLQTSADSKEPIANGLQRPLQSDQVTGIDTKTPPKGDPIARLHGDQGDGGGGSEEPHRHAPPASPTDDGTRAYCLALAAELDYPEVTFRPGNTLRAGAKGWGQFLRHHVPTDDILAAVEVLERMPKP